MKKLKKSYFVLFLFLLILFLNLTPRISILTEEENPRPTTIEGNVI